MTDNENTTSTSCSFTDSGIIITENKTTFNSNESSTPAADKERHQTKEASSTDSENKNNIEIKKFINITKNETGNVHNARTEPSPLLRDGSPTTSIRSTSISIEPSRSNPVSNPVDSSVVDSDSDFKCNAEGIHSNYVVKKLCQQTTYPPNSPDIPSMGTGLTEVSQQINQNESTLGLPPIAKMTSQAPTTSEIVRMAMSHTTDVNLGDKYFYEGSVTIQQVLIDGGENWKSTADGSGQNNPIFGPNGDPPRNADNSSMYTLIPPSTHRQQQQPPPYKKYNRPITYLIAVGFIVLTILAAILIVLTSTLFRSKVKSKVIPINLRFISREGWNARNPKGELNKLKLPVSRVIISHSAWETCNSMTECTERLKDIQNFHMDSNGWDDVGYNFMIGGDGLVYVGRGWYQQGAHTKGYNVDSVGICLVGTFTIVEPTKKQMLAAQQLIEDGVRRRTIAPKYRLYGARQFSTTESPGETVFNIIKKWPNFSNSI